MKLSRLIVVGGLLLIVVIFLVSFVGFQDQQNGLTSDENIDASDPYHMKRRLVPPEILERDLTHRNWPTSGVDVIYLWTTPGSDAYLGEYNKYFQNSLNDERVVPENDPFDFARLNRYFLRGLESFVPWFRNLIIIVPPEVKETPFNTSDPRIRLLRHDQFVTPNDMLPNFNWRSLLLHLVMNDNQLSEQFLVFDDQSFPLSYIAPSSLITSTGKIILPVFTPNQTSTPRDDTEDGIIKYTNKILRTSIIEAQQESISKNARELFSNLEDVNFETRGGSFLDKRIITQLKQIMSKQIEETKQHRFRQKNSVDIIQAHHQFIYLMNRLHMQPYYASEILEKIDQNKDEKLQREELLELAKTMKLEQGQVGNFIATLFDKYGEANQGDLKHEEQRHDTKAQQDSNQLIKQIDKENTEQKDTHTEGYIRIQTILADDVLTARIYTAAIQSEFRYEFLNSSTIAIDLKQGRRLDIGKVLYDIKEGKKTSLWLGKTMMSAQGLRARSYIDSVLAYILPKPSKLEKREKSYQHMSLYIGAGFMAFFVSSCWIVSKFLLSNPRRRIRD